LSGIGTYRFRAQENSRVASFGMRLKQEREKQSVTLDDISLSTKISTRMLRALEEEQFDQLPGGIFNKGFIRAYARCLGMDEDQAIADYMAATTVGPPGKKSENDDQAPILEPPPREENPAAASLPWGTFAVVLLIVALAFAAWGFYSREEQKETPAAAAPAAAQPSISPNVTAVNPPPQPITDAATTSAEAVRPSQPAVPSPAADEPAPAPAANPSVATPSQSPPPDQRPERFAVLIKAREDSWLSVSIDGEVSTQGTLTASTQKSVRAANEITIRAGNIGALDFEFNGKRLPTQGAYGEVKTLTFDANGLRPPAPKPEAPAQSPAPPQ
jgi:cytoskeleton protein RodZ